MIMGLIACFVAGLYLGRWFDALPSVPDPIPVKPFIIYAKKSNFPHPDGLTVYFVIDAKGNRFKIKSAIDYMLGDTLFGRSPAYSQAPVIISYWGVHRIGYLQGSIAARQGTTLENTDIRYKADSLDLINRLK